MWAWTGSLGDGRGLTIVVEVAIRSWWCGWTGCGEVGADGLKSGLDVETVGGRW